MVLAFSLSIAGLLVVAVHAVVAVVALRAAHGRAHRHGPVERVVLATVSRLIRWAVRAGVRLGPVVMLTVPGRTSGLPRSTPVDLWQDGERHYLVATHDAGAAWVRNLRAAGSGEVSLGRRRAAFTAVELPPQDALQVLERVIRPRLDRPLAGLVLRQTFGSSGAGALPDEELARRHPVFALSLLGPAPGGSRVVTSTRTPRRRLRVPVLLIGLGLVVAGAHAALGLAGRLDAASWISGVVMGALLAGLGNHLRIFGPRQETPAPRA